MNDEEFLKMNTLRVQDYENLDKIWREIIIKMSITQNMNEFILMKFLVTHQNEFEVFTEYPYILGWEFPLGPEQSHFQKFDLIFHDGKENYPIVETKYIKRSGGRTARTRRRHQRKKGGVQANDAAIAFVEHYNKENVKSGYNK